jgi:hypothetical protein
MIEHTPGPWTIEGVGVGGHYKTINGARIVDCNGVCVATITRKADKPIDQKKADARLIAAAPDLLEAARIVLASLDARIEGASKAKMTIPVFEGIAALHAAVAKATGEETTWKRYRENSVLKN